MKALENPKHDSFSPHRISDPEKRKSAEVAMKQLSSKLREAIREYTAIFEEDEVVLDELSRLFAEFAQGDIPPSASSDKDPEKYVFNPPKRRTVRNPAAPKTSPGSDNGEGGSGGQNDATGGTESGDGPNDGEKDHGKASRDVGTPVRLGDFRNRICQEGAQAEERLLWFTPEKSGRMSLKLEATGISASEPLFIVEASEGQIHNGGLEIDVIKDKRTQIQVKFESGYGGPLEAFATLLSEEAAA